MSVVEVEVEVGSTVIQIHDKHVGCSVVEPALDEVGIPLDTIEVCLAEYGVGLAIAFKSVDEAK